MPTYEYVCESCEHEFEQFQSITAEPIKSCPECRKKTVRRKIGTGAGILFRGGGFYETDYRSKSYTEAAKKEAEASKSSGNTKTDNGSPSKSESAASTSSQTSKASSPSKGKSKSSD
ncbi:MAG: hypothetical protein KatS3mg104_1897 [Phycisphaerae bacterium]|jgi:putative FmdB family regulatory protein|nr:MAG: hypothetical protein KatS3mg104_1897 [Phycisphaerae bacterium]